ncbi:uncharacterized protein LOC135470368 isoform X2 [Liolophura sinensis]|uniref:uncharacterized protein LOC135470368 isoform X2 n=1 Tax=Liolophura sinensis TaxID=3198878 RepID=UPI003159717F
MRFHHVHGASILLSDDSSSAQRSEKHFCNGLVFSDQAVKILQKVCVELGCVTTWSGGLRVGVTTVDPGTLKPSDLPKYAFPDLTDRDGYWFCSLSEAELDTGTRVNLYVDSGGHLQIFINSHHRGVFLSHLPTNRPLWLVFDIYGNTQSAKFVRPDDAPTEILARGPDAVRAYEEACTSGVQSLFRTRLMLVGQDGVGKTSLRRALVGQKHRENEKSTDGIDLSASCSFNLRDKTAWRLAIQGQTTTDRQEEEGKSNSQTGVRETADEEYHKAIATNIVHELLYQRRVSQEVARKQSSKQHQWSPAKPRSTSPAKTLPQPGVSRDKARLLSRSSSASLTSDLSVPPELIRSVPDRVVQLVQTMLEQRKRSSTASGRVSRENRGKEILLNIWDFAGHAVYYTTHQVFLSSRAVYVIVFNLCHNLDETEDENEGKECSGNEFSTVGYMDFWMRSIHAHAADNARQSVDQSMLSPPIFVVGTHRDSLHPDPTVRQNMVEEKFHQLELYIKDKPYAKHIITPFFAVENSLEGEETVSELRHEIEEVSSREPYMGEQRPLKWLRFEHRLEELVAEGSHYATYDQIEDIAGEEEITSDTEVKTMLQFYHDLGLVIYYGGSGALDNLLRNTVILNPQWLIHLLKRIIAATEVKDKTWLSLASDWQKLEDCGILQESLLDYLWHDVLDQKFVLLSLMEKFDLLCTRPQVTSMIDQYGASYYVPVRFKPYEEGKSLYCPNPKDVTFYLDFNGFLPDGLFHRILTRAIRWSQDLGGMELELYRREARFFLDADHDFFLEMCPRPYCRIKVAVVNVRETSDTEDGEGNKDVLSPNPKACAKVRNFLESTLSDLKAMWMRRLYCRASVECPCGRVCKLHNNSACQLNPCIHFLDLDECLANKVVLCEHRRVKTNKFTKWFPEPIHLGSHGPVLPSIFLEETHGNIEKQCPNLPSWVKGAAKLLNGGLEDQDWLSLAKQLGYKQAKLDKFNDDLNPALALLTDWILTSGNTALSVDVLITYLEQMKREDIVEAIQAGQERDSDPAQIFISYQWDSQEEVQALRDRLERTGFTCWMDIGQMGGGDQLYTKIDMGIRQAKVVLACVSPKYIVSHYCNRELSLADLVQKPIIPVVFDLVTWPPPGGMSLVFSQLVYINMKGVGGHGGSGAHADLEDKYNEIIHRISQYAEPAQTPRHPTSVLKDNSKIMAENSYTSIADTIGPFSGFSPQGAQGNPAQTIPSLEVHRSMSRLSGSRASADTTIPPPVVERVHVSKCGVCSIL